LDATLVVAAFTAGTTGAATLFATLV